MLLLIETLVWLLVRVVFLTFIVRVALIEERSGWLEGFGC